MREHQAGPGQVLPVLSADHAASVECLSSGSLPTLVGRCYAGLQTTSSELGNLSSSSLRTRLRTSVSLSAGQSGGSAGSAAQ